MSLYFIAILPDEDLKAEIEELKKEFAEKYDARHALKLPAHITLLIPFKLGEKEEQRLIQTLTGFAEHQSSFPLRLSGFNSFPPRVIFIDVANKEPVKFLHERLERILIDYGFAGVAKEKESFHPHLTIATRDLKRQEYKKAWTNFKNCDFERKWLVDKIVLFKHNGRKWDLYEEFPFGEN